MIVGCISIKYFEKYMCPWIVFSSQHKKIEFFDICVNLTD